MEPTDNRTQTAKQALAAGLDRALALFPAEIEYAVSRVEEQRLLLGAVDDPMIVPAAPQRPPT